MALKPCRECKKKVSTEAVTCPNCGVPNPTSKITRKTTSEPTFNYKFGKVEVGKEKVIRDTVSRSKSTKEEITSWENFMDGKLDLKTAFWGYGFFGSIVIGIGCGVLVETVSNVFNIVYVISITVLIIGLWQCASNYKKIMSQKKQSESSGSHFEK